VSERTGAPRSAWYALAVLTLVSLFAFVDRGVLVLQAEVIRRQLGLSDLQLGILQGTAVSLFAAAASYPLGWLADRFDRRRVLIGCVVFWSLAVVGAGLAQGYGQLVLACALVGAGEAGLVPLVYALIPDLFPEKRRQLANSIYTLGSGAASAAALALCGQVIGWVEAWRPALPAAMQALDGWRLSFFAVALPAPLMVLLITTIALQSGGHGGRQMAGSEPHATVPMRPFVRQHQRMFVCFIGGVGLTTFGFNAVGSWVAVIYIRVFGQTAQQVGAVLGSVALVGTAVGFLISVFGVRWFGSRLDGRLQVRALGLAALSAALLFMLMPLAGSATQMYAIHGVYIALAYAAIMLYPTVLQGMVPRRMRARLVAITGVVGAIATACASPATGMVSDHFGHLSNGLLVAAVVVAVPALLAAVALFFLCERSYVQTAAAAARADAAD
jgi:predicted MFS family arabinose efflux permease